MTPFSPIPATTRLHLTGHDLTVDDVVSVARSGRVVALDGAARERMACCRHVIDFLIGQKEKVYGLTTGFGKLRDKVIATEDTQKLQYNLIRSHACGVGQPFPEDVVRGAMLLRANTLCRGNSGIRPVVVQLVLEMLNQNITPLIPEKGSVGASGDLAPLSHMVLVLMGDPDGQVYRVSRRRDLAHQRITPLRSDFVTIREIQDPGSYVCEQTRQQWARFEQTKRDLGINTDPLRCLEAKEGLALNNGTQFMTAIAALALHDAYFCLRTAELAAALSLEANRGVRAAYDPRIHHSRGQSHQAEVARRVIAWCEGSQIIDLLLNSASIGQARKKLDEAAEHLEEIRSELDFRGLNPALIDEVSAMISGLERQLAGLIPAAPGSDSDDPATAARRAFLERCAQRDFTEQIPALNDYLSRCRRESTAILATIQQPNFPQAERSPRLREALTTVQGLLGQAVPSSPPVQDDYSFRCFPQVIACAWRSMEHVRGIVRAELNAATDNPLIFPPDADADGPAPTDPAAYGAWLSDPTKCPHRVRQCRLAVMGGGNFHGEPIAIAMDYFTIAIAEVGNIAERRIAHLVDPSLSQGLPGFLIDSSGLNSGFMIPQYTAASLVSENKVLCHPASVDSIPTCAGSEDHVSMGTIAARKSAVVLENVRQVIAIELLTARQGIAFRLPMVPGEPLQAFLKRFSIPAPDHTDPRLPFHRDDGVMYVSMRGALSLMDDVGLRVLIEEKVPFVG